MKNKLSANQKRVLGIIVAVLIVFVIVMLIRIAFLNNEKKKLEEELGEVEAESIEVDEENAALQALLNGENESVLMEQFAHQNGYVHPDEHVYIYGN